MPSLYQMPDSIATRPEWVGVVQAQVPSIAAKFLLTIPWEGLGRGQVWHGASATHLCPHCYSWVQGPDNLQTLCPAQYCTYNDRTYNDKYRWGGGGGASNKVDTLYYIRWLFPFILILSSSMSLHFTMSWVWLCILPIRPGSIAAHHAA